MRRHRIGDVLEDFGEDLAELLNKVATLFSSAASATRESSGRVGQKLFDRTEEWLEDARDNLSRMQKRGRKSFSAATERMGPEHVIGLALVAGLGLAIAMIIQKRNRDS